MGDKKKLTRILAIIGAVCVACLAIYGAFALVRDLNTAPAPEPVSATTQVEPTPEPDTSEPAQTPESPDTATSSESPDNTNTPDNTDTPDNSDTPNEQPTSIEVVRGSYYYDVEHVVLYLDTFGELPDNYITKSEARKQGWEGGVPTKIFEGAAIGGDNFSNREKALPTNTSYHEADIDTDGKSSRGARRLVYSEDGHYYYTTDHYETYTEVIVENGQVVFA